MTLVITSLFTLTVLGIFIYKTHRRAFDNSKTMNMNRNKISVVTSFYPLYFFAAKIGGDKVAVKNITPSGAEPHDYDPSTRDIADIEKSNILVLNGGVESWGNKIRDNVKGTGVIVITAGDGLLTQQVNEDGQNQTDPHVWLDPILAKKEAHKIADGLMKADSVNAKYYLENETALDNQLDSLDISYKNGLSSCKEKDIITSHAAFGYLATRYHLTQVPIAGLSPDAEPSAKQLADIATFARVHNINYIFFESLVSPKLSQTIATEIGAKTLVLDPIEGVSDADMKIGKNYLTIMENNLTNLQTALDCK